MSKSNASRHPAEAWARRVLAAHPKAQKIVKESRRDRSVMLKKFLGFWPDWCFFPMTGGKRIFNEEGFNHFRSPSETALLMASLLWMQSKGIYRFDQTLPNDQFGKNLYKLLSRIICKKEYPSNLQYYTELTLYH